MTDHFHELHGGLAGVSQASGFIQRMMAEVKKKHKGQYKKPTGPNDYNSSMKKYTEFKMRKLANPDQGGVNDSKYGASPFIIRHFANGYVPIVKKSEPQETDEQRSARLQQKAEELEQKAKELMENAKPKPEPKAEPKPEPKEDDWVPKGFPADLVPYLTKHMLTQSGKTTFANPNGWTAQRLAQYEKEKKEGKVKPYQYPKGHPTDYAGRPLSYAELSAQMARNKKR